jgi:hypothetical protein
MGRRKATDEAALRDLQDALRVVVDAAHRRSDPDADPSARRRAMRDLRHGIELVRAWQRPRGGDRPMTPSSLGGRPA